MGNLPDGYFSEDEFSRHDPSGYLQWRKGQKVYLTFSPASGVGSFEVRADPSQVDQIVGEHATRGMKLLRKRVGA